MNRNGWSEAKVHLKIKKIKTNRKENMKVITYEENRVNIIYFFLDEIFFIFDFNWLKAHLTMSKTTIEVEVRRD